MQGVDTLVSVMTWIAVAVGAVVLILILKDARRLNIPFVAQLFEEFFGEWRGREWLPFAMVVASSAVNWISHVSSMVKLVLAVSFPGLYVACFLAWAAVRILGISNAKTPREYAVRAIYLVIVLAILCYTYSHSVLPPAQRISHLIPFLSFIEGCALAPVVVRLLRKARYTGTPTLRESSM